MEHIRKKEFKKAAELLDPYRLRYSEVCQEAYAVLKYKTKGDLKAVQVIEKKYVKYGWLEFAEAYEVLALYYFNLKEKRKVVVKLIVKALNKPKSFHDQLHNFRLYRFLVSVLLSLDKKKDAKEIVQDMIKRWPSKKAVILKLLNKKAVTTQ